MNSTLKATLCACFCILLAACGKSSSSDDNNKNFNANEDDIFAYCLENPNTFTCQELKNDARDLGFGDYYGGDTDTDFLGGGGLCGCGSGTPVFYGRGRHADRFCEPSRISRKRNRRNALYVRYRSGRRGDRLTIRFDSYSRNQHYSDFDHGGSCPDVAEVRCQGQAACDATGIPSTCIRVPGTNYGYCQRNDRI